MKSRKDAIIERFAGIGGAIGFVLGIVAIVQAVSDGQVVSHALLFLGIFTALGVGAGWLAGIAVAWMVSAAGGATGELVDTRHVTAPGDAELIAASSSKPAEQVGHVPVEARVKSDNLAKVSEYGRSVTELRRAELITASASKPEGRVGHNPAEARVNSDNRTNRGAVRMQCTKCRADIPEASKFCPDCGARAIHKEEGRAPDEIDIHWLSDVMIGAGYEVTINEEAEAEFPQLAATHPIRINLVMTIARSRNLITIRYLWPLKRKDLATDKEFLVALNAANRSSWYDRFFILDDSGAPPLGWLQVYFYIPMTTSITDYDITNFLEKEGAEFRPILESSGLLPFIGA